MQRQRVECQRLFTKIISGFSSLSYERRLSLLKNSNLVFRVEMSKLIILYMIIHILINTDLEHINLLINTNNTKANGLTRLVLPAPRTSIMLHSFAYTAGKMWNVLPIVVISALS